MKKSILKKAAAVFAAFMVAFSASAAVFAATSAPATTRPRPTASSSSSSSSRTTDSDDSSSSSDNNSSSSDEEDNTSSTSSPSETRVTSTPVTAAPVATTTTNRSYTTKGGAFLWFLLSVLVNTVISFAIGNRFYKMSRKENHVTAEIRALRRDIEEKFADNIGGFAEQGIDIENSNENYSMKSDGLKMTPASTTSVDAPVEDIYKQWEEQMARRRAQRRAAINTRPEIDESDFEDERPVRKKYQPKRTSNLNNSRKKYSKDSIDFEEDIEDIDDDRIEEIDDMDEEMLEDTRDKHKKAKDVTKKAKSFINNIFPLKDDDDDDIG